MHTMLSIHFVLSACHTLTLSHTPLVSNREPISAQCQRDDRMLFAFSLGNENIEQIKDPLKHSTTYTSMSSISSCP